MEIDLEFVALLLDTMFQPNTLLSELDTTDLSAILRKLSAGATTVIPRKQETVMDAVEWILNDAAFKSPEEISAVAQRWLERLLQATGTEKRERNKSDAAV